MYLFLLTIVHLYLLSFFLYCFMFSHETKFKIILNCQYYFKFHQNLSVFFLLFLFPAKFLLFVNKQYSYLHNVQTIFILLYTFQNFYQNLIISNFQKTFVSFFPSILSQNFHLFFLIFFVVFLLFIFHCFADLNSYVFLLLYNQYYCYSYMLKIIRVI